MSILLGLLVGIQRQWAESSLAGVRTFSLISLLGTISAFLAERFGEWILIGGLAGVITAMVVGNVSHDKHERAIRVGLSTEISMIIMFCIGAMVRLSPIWIAAASAGAVAVILQAKTELHAVATRFTSIELKAIMQFVLISLVLFPIIPNQTIDSLQVINPREIWLMVVLIVGLALAGYIAYKFFGDRAGTFLSGILGGMISSTATTVNYSKTASKGSESSVLHGATIILIAWTVVYFRIFLVSMIVAPNFRQLWMPLSGMFLVSALSTLWAYRKSRNIKSKMPFQENPSEIRTALIFAAIYSAVLYSIAFAKKNWGSEGLITVAALSGITDMDAITLSTSRLVQAQNLSPNEGWPLIITAVTSNVFFKGIVVLSVGGRRLFQRLLLPWVLSLFTGIGLLIFREIL